MPEIVWINNGDNQQTWLHSCNKHHTHRMVRADIAEELARSLEFMLRGPVRSSPMAVKECEEALARYRAITP